MQVSSLIRRYERKVAKQGTMTPMIIPLTSYPMTSMSTCISTPVDHMKKQLLRKDPTQIRVKVQPVDGAMLGCDFLKERVLMWKENISVAANRDGHKIRS